MLAEALEIRTNVVKYPCILKRCNLFWGDQKLAQEPLALPSISGIYIRGDLSIDEESKDFIRDNF